MISSKLMVYAVYFVLLQINKLQVVHFDVYSGWYWYLLYLSYICFFTSLIIDIKDFINKKRKNK